MHNEYKNGEKVIVCGNGENNGTIYRNIPAIVIERDPYYKDYLVRFKNGIEDWISPESLRKPYKKRKRSK